MAAGSPLSPHPRGQCRCHAEPVGLLLGAFTETASLTTGVSLSSSLPSKTGVSPDSKGKRMRRVRRASRAPASCGPLGHTGTASHATPHRPPPPREPLRGRPPSWLRVLRGGPAWEEDLVTALLGGFLGLTPAPQGRCACVRAHVPTRTCRNARLCCWSALPVQREVYPHLHVATAGPCGWQGTCGNLNHT